MTTPAQPDTGAGGQSATDASQQNSNTGQDTTTTQQPGTGDEWSELVTSFGTEGLTPGQVRERLAASRKWEGRAKENYEAAQKAGQLEQQMTALKQALGLETAEQLPQHVQQRLSEAEQAKADAEARMTELTYQVAVTQAAAKAGLDAEALLDSGKFRSAVFDQLADEFDPDDDLPKAIAEALKGFSKDARFAGTRPTTRSGGEFNGAPGGTKPITDEELARMSPEQISKALEEGRLNHLL